mmetsp:Transcript_27674/g.39584  ORF Transcript_27674/g.39584 Transcript_27674/m.39584 type:complete len:148 (+) Transcript_27674:236-679(+)
MTQPLQELENNTFYCLVGFWPVQFHDICSCLSLIPARIKTASHCVASREEALFLLLLRWKHIATWDHTKRVMRRGRCWCITVYKAIFALVAQHYRRCVKVIDYRRVVSLLGDWTEALQAHTGCSLDVLYFADGKPWQLSRPGRGMAA